MTSEPIDSLIAIVGASCRFPGAPDLDAYRRLVLAGERAFESVAPTDAQWSALNDIDPSAGNWVGVAAPIADALCFDPAFFGISEAQATAMDPQHRVLLECAWAAMEHAGIVPTGTRSVGVFVGAPPSTYLLEHLAAGTGARAVGYDATALANQPDFLATTLSYHLDLRGPSYAVQTACSSALVALHVACDALLSEQCDLALAGGVTVRYPQRTGYNALRGGVLSPSGHCRPYARDADGTVFGSGAGLVVLQRMADALAQKSHIVAVVSGSATNNDGHAKAGYAAPSESGQVRVITEAWSVAGVEPDDIDYVEGHGTGTLVGDEIELRALERVFAERSLAHPCYLGSAKANVGHLESASGVAGLLRAVIALESGRIPPSPGCAPPHPRLAESSRLAADTEGRAWPGDRTVRRAAVSSFGIGGTNAHVVLQGAPDAPQPVVVEPAWPICVSAPTAEGARRVADRLAAHLQAAPELDLGAVSHTLRRGREAHRHRVATAASTPQEAADALRRAPVRAPDEPPRSLWVFSGQGVRRIREAARHLRASRPHFAEAFDHCASIAASVGGPRLLEALTSEPGDTDVDQPLIVALGWSLASELTRLGARPDAVLGHSLGEVAAAAVGGGLSIEDAMGFAVRRGAAMARMGVGRMLVVLAPRSHLPKSVTEDPEVALAAENASSVCVLSGSPAAVALAEDRLSSSGIATRELQTTRAFHSPMMDGALDDIERAAAQVAFLPTELPMVSSVTGRILPPGTVLDAAYWRQQARSPVRFAAALEHWVGDTGAVLVEIGAGSTVGRLAALDHPHLRAFATCPSAPDPGDPIAGCVADLFAHGVDLEVPTGDLCARIPLPTHPFARTVYDLPRRRDRPALTPLDWTRLEDPRDAFRVPSWTRVARSLPAPQTDRETWCILGSGEPSRVLADALHRRGRRAVVVEHPGGRLAAAELFETIRTASEPGELVGVLSLWSLGEDRALEQAFTELREVLRALDETGVPQFWQVLRGSQDVLGTDRVDPMASMWPVVGIVSTQEQVGLWCGHIDVDALDEHALAAAVDEVLAERPRPVVAVRSGRTWCPTSAVAHVPPDSAPTTLKRGGTYLITGGLGRFGRALATHLVRAWDATVVLTTRGEGRARDTRWRTLARLGDRVHRLVADASELEAMRRAVAFADELGGLDGVIHAAGTVGPEIHRPVRDAERLGDDPSVRAKIVGVRTLARALEGRSLDFCLMTSSLSPILGGLGLGVYGAANRFMDAFALRARTPDQPWRTINWEGWAAPDAGGDGEFNERARLALTDAQVAECFEHAMRMPEHPNLIIATADLEARRRAWVTEHRPSKATRPVRAAGSGDPQEIREQLTGFVTELVGKRFGPDENLYDHGVTSLTAVQLLARIRETYGVDLALRVVFENPTIDTLTLGLLELLSQDDESELAALLAEIEAMSHDEVAELLARDPGGGE